MCLTHTPKVNTWYEKTFELLCVENPHSKLWFYRQLALYKKNYKD